MIAAADAAAATSPWVTAAVALSVGLFGGGGLVALLRVRTDKNKIVVDAAQGAVIVQSGVIEALREELNRVKGERQRLEQLVQNLRNEVQALRRETADTASRVAAVEEGSGGT